MENENASGKNLSPKENLALQILEFTQEQIIMRMPYMSRAVLKMPAVFTAEKDETKKYQSMYADPDTMGTDGMSVYCNAEGIIRWFENAPRMLPRRYLHMVLHCLFSHPFQYTSLKEDYWDLAADMAVEHVIMNLGMKELASDSDPEKKKVLREIEIETGKITAEKIYHLLISDEDRAYDMLKLKGLFVADTHDFWIDRELTVSDMIVSRQCSLMELEDKIEEWIRAGENTRIDMETQTGREGKAPGALVKKVSRIRRDDNDYTEFLRQFAVDCEEVHINQDEFDYIFYTYGIELYDDMPLIEPLEYRDAKKIRDLVIAIDTSGSCQGRTIRDFLNKTYSILKNTQSFMNRVNVHIIQSDCEIQRDIKITSEREFEKYIQDVEVAGSGGTDFRPVFSYVDDMIEAGEFLQLQGLIYFTDGIGKFPAMEPDYRTAFVFLDSGQKIPDVPEWAVKTVFPAEN